MPLDPQVKAYLEEVAAAGLPPYHSLSPEEAREAMLARSARFLANPEQVSTVEIWRIEGPGGPLTLRIYVPEGTRPLPVLVYFHGGGWVQGSLDTHDSLCRALANAGGCIVASVDYRLAPEHKFPAQVEDAYAATQWVASNAASFGGDAAQLAVGGDSAGGAMAATVTLMARDRRGAMPSFQLLFYPVTNYSFETASYQQNGSGYMLTRDDMAWFWHHYLADETDGLHPYASPLRATELQGLPPALVITAEFDPLRDEGEAYAERLRQAGVPVELLRYDGMIHNFVRMSSVLDRGREAVLRAGQSLHEALGQGTR